jgi:HD superfamily phosphodiesterase/nucleotide-binding universal stress UspA family protein
MANKTNANIDALEERFMELFSDVSKELGKLPKLYAYHSYLHTLKVVAYAEELSFAEGLDPYDHHLVTTAALLHDIGFLVNQDDHEYLGTQWANEHLPKYGYSREDIETINSAILATKIPQSPKNIHGEILCDADLFYLGTKAYVRISNLLRKEWALQGNTFSDTAWTDLQIKFLKGHEYFTDSAKERLNFQKRENLEAMYAKRVEEDIHPLNIFVPVDFTENSLNALKYAVRMATDIPKSEVKALHVVSASWQIQEKQAKLKELIQSLKNPYHIKITSNVIAGNHLEEIGRAAHHYKADVVVAGTHNPKGIKRLATSDALTMVENSRMPFLSLQNREGPQPKQPKLIAIPVQKAGVHPDLIDVVKGLVKPFDARVALLHKPLEGESARDEIEEELKKVIVLLRREHIPIKSHAISAQLNFTEGVIEKARELDVNVIAVGHSTKTSFWKRVSENFDQKLLENSANIPILTLNVE